MFNDEWDSAASLLSSATKLYSTVKKPKQQYTPAPIVVQPPKETIFGVSPMVIYIGIPIVLLGGILLYKQLRR